jgi:hypothetical protein
VVVTTPREALAPFIRTKNERSGSLKSVLTALVADPSASITDILTALAPWVMEWRPIEECDAEPSEFKHWIGFDGYNVREMKRWSGGWSFEGGNAFNPTHFMPLPNPPQVTP